MTKFRDRSEAGRLLGERLLRYRDSAPIVLALPRGGVPVGLEISRTLQAPLDVFVVRKLGAPDQAELGIGAVAQGGTRILNERILNYLQVSEEYLDRVTCREQEEVERRLTFLRGDAPSPEVRNRTVILADDGLATGVTALAAMEAVTKREPHRVVLAVPVCAAQTADAIKRKFDDIVSLETPSDLQAIGLWYENFDQVSDDEVIELLALARREQDLRDGIM